MYKLIQVDRRDSSSFLTSADTSLYSCEKISHSIVDEWMMPLSLNISSLIGVFMADFLWHQGNFFFFTFKYDYKTTRFASLSAVVANCCRTRVLILAWRDFSSAPRHGMARLFEFRGNAINESEKSRSTARGFSYLSVGFRQHSATRLTSCSRDIWGGSISEEVEVVVFFIRKKLLHTDCNESLALLSPELCSAVK